MKKTMLFAAVAALALASCAKNEVIQNPDNQQAVSFGVYTGQAATKATYGDINTVDKIQASTDGFGVFAYYTKHNTWASAATTATPDFMYNQQVVYKTTYGTPTDFTAQKYPTHWYYTPLKYWPNGQNTTTVEAGTINDKLSFFAYAPHIATDASGAPGTPYPASGQGITAVSTNATTNVPTVNFTVPSNAHEQIDLLWAIPILDQTKQNLASNETFNFKHALAKLGLKVQAVVDASSPSTSNLTDNGDDTFDNGETWIILESLEMKANGTKQGVLSLDSTDPDAPNWSSKTGETVVTYNSSSFPAANIKTADGITGFKVTETAQYLNESNSPMIIPNTVNSGDYVVTANYWVITKDSALGSGFSTIQQIIKKTSTANIDFAAGKMYNIVVLLGLNSVDFSVSVADWTPIAGDNIELPHNN